nr:PREDICTED: uncharacterized protein LOC106702537 [Latimeria chalumnae]|eukprot:XP_014340650.1 PREDICTED: uncharacterized protein LOC106702537 [Latimeria chalumnae]
MPSTGDPPKHCVVKVEPPGQGAPWGNAPPTSINEIRPPVMPPMQNCPSATGVPYAPLPATHQVRGVPIFTGDADCRVSIEDWVNDIQYLLNATNVPGSLHFPTLVRYLGGGARKLVLNLPPAERCSYRAFEELRAEYSDCHLSLDPMADFYERHQRPLESASVYAIELDALLREIEENINGGQPLPDRNYKLTQQFMRGIHEKEVRDRLAPMQPRYLSFKQLQAELRQLAREKMCYKGETKVKKASSMPQTASTTEDRSPEGAPAPQASNPTAALSEAVHGLTALVQELTVSQKQHSERMGQLEALLLQQTTVTSEYSPISKRGRNVTANARGTHSTGGRSYATGAVRRVILLGGCRNAPIETNYLVLA